MIAIALPFPPSVNRIWRSKSYGAGKAPGHYLDPRYATWKRVCDNEVMAMRPRPRVEGRFHVTLILNEKKRANRDADNFAKAPLDFLQRAGVIENDKLADSVSIRWGYAPEGVRIEITASAARVA